MVDTPTLPRTNICISPELLKLKSLQIKNSTVEEPTLTQSDEIVNTTKIFNLANWYVTQNKPERAFIDFKLAADNGHINALRRVAELYMDGIGTVRDMDKWQYYHNLFESATTQKELFDIQDDGNGFRQACLD